MQIETVLHHFTLKNNHYNSLSLPKICKLKTHDVNWWMRDWKEIANEISKLFMWTIMDTKEGDVGIGVKQRTVFNGWKRNNMSIFMLFSSQNNQEETPKYRILAWFRRSNNLLDTKKYFLVTMFGSVQPIQTLPRLAYDLIQECIRSWNQYQQCKAVTFINCVHCHGFKS